MKGTNWVAIVQSYKPWHGELVCSLTLYINCWFIDYVHRSHQVWLSLIPGLGFQRQPMLMQMLRSSDNVSCTWVLSIRIESLRFSWSWLQPKKVNQWIGSLTVFLLLSVSACQTNIWHINNYWIIYMHAYDLTNIFDIFLCNWEHCFWQWGFSLCPYGVCLLLWKTVIKMSEKSVILVSALNIRIWRVEKWNCKSWQGSQETTGVPGKEPYEKAAFTFMCVFKDLAFVNINHPSSHVYNGYTVKWIILTQAKQPSESDS